jgi:glyoxylase-like metal-dependent hydrolase (beta-lactamase superfamily II)
MARHFIFGGGMSDVELVEAAALVRGRRQLGEFELVFCSDGSYKLDGGAMFGVVPKTMWSARIAADEQNRITLGLNTAVVKTGTAVVVIETGVGNKQPEKMKKIFELEERLPLSFKAAGISKNDVTHVVNTHLHFDHCGWNTTLQEDGSVVPTFPKARYFAAAGELAHGRLQLERDRVSYLGPNYDPLIASGQLTVIDPGGVGGYGDGDARLFDASGALRHVAVTTSTEIVPGVWVESYPGHTAAMLGVHVQSGGEHACYIGDLIPTRHHLDPTWGMGYDLDPVTCIAQKHRFLKSAIAEKWLVMFTHDHELPAGYVGLGEKGRPVVIR